MKHDQRSGSFLRRIHTFPLFLLSLSRGKRVLIVILAYALGVPGIWFFFPILHNAASMLLPLICICWLFRYRGLLISMLSTIIVFWLIYHYILGDVRLDQMYITRIIVGFTIVLWLGLTICWLRTATDTVYAARRQALDMEQKRLQAFLA